MSAFSPSAPDTPGRDSYELRTGERVRSCAALGLSTVPSVGRGRQG